MYQEYIKFQREIRKIDEDTVFMEQHLCSTGRLCAGTASGTDEETFFDAEELLYGSGIVE